MELRTTEQHEAYEEKICNVGNNLNDKFREEAIRLGLNGHECLDILSRLTAALILVWAKDGEEVTVLIDYMKQLSKTLKTFMDGDGVDLKRTQ